MNERKFLTVDVVVNVSAEKAWRYWTEPAHIMQWNNASDDWHTPHATADLREGGRFLSRMEARDGSQGFDFNGVFTKVIPQKVLDYAIEGGRTVSVIFESKGGTTHITETFEAEDENPLEMQRAGWQSIMDNFKKYAESH